MASSFSTVSLPKLKICPIIPNNLNQALKVSYFLIPSTHSTNNSMQIKNESSRLITLIVPFLLPIVILTFSLALTGLNRRIVQLLHAFSAFKCLYYAALYLHELILI